MQVLFRCITKNTQVSACKACKMGYPFRDVPQFIPQLMPANAGKSKKSVHFCDLFLLGFHAGMGIKLKCQGYLRMPRISKRVRTSMPDSIALVANGQYAFAQGLPLRGSRMLFPSITLSVCCIIIGEKRAMSPEEKGGTHNVQPQHGSKNPRTDGTEADARFMAD